MDKKAQTALEYLVTYGWAINFFLLGVVMIVVRETGIVLDRINRRFKDYEDEKK